jgi:integrase
VYVRIRGKMKTKVRIKGSPWSKEFMERYERVIAGLPAEPAQAGMKQRHAVGTWAWLCQQFFSSPEFKANGDGYKTVLRRRLESTFGEPIKKDSPYLLGDCPISDLTKKKIRFVRDLKSEYPEGANNRLKAIRNVLKWGMEAHDDVVTSNPARDVPYFKTGSEGHHTWSVDEVATYIRHHGTESMAVRALFVFLFTGVRCCNAFLLGRQMVKDGILTFTVAKRRRTDRPKVLSLPVLPALAKALSVGPQDNLTWLVTSYGHPFKSSKALGNWFKKRCVEAGLTHCSAHGCRKAGATIAAENGATDAQMQAIFGWDSAKMAEHYRKKAAQKRLAGDAMRLINFDAAIAEAAVAVAEDGTK